MHKVQKPHRNLPRAQHNRQNTLGDIALQFLTYILDAVMPPAAARHHQARNHINGEARNVTHPN